VPVLQRPLRLRTQTRGTRQAHAQYNPAKSEGAETLGQWMNAVMSIKGDSGGTMRVADAVSMIHATPPEQRSRFARDIWAIRRRRGSDGIAPF
jgi:hypothetical protein